MAKRVRDQRRSDRPHRRLRRGGALVRDGARAVVRAIAAHAPAGVRARPCAGRRHDADPERPRLASRPCPARGADRRRGAFDVLDRDRDPDAGREQAVSFRRRPGEFLGVAVSGSGGRAAARDDGRVRGRKRARAGFRASRRARPGGAGAGRAGRFRPARIAALLPFRRRDEEPGILHGGVPAGGAG